MKSIFRTTPRFLVLGALLLVAVACSCDGSTSGQPEPASDFLLTDSNPASPTIGEDRQLSEVTGRVIVIHFVLYS